MSTEILDTSGSPRAAGGADSPETSHASTEDVVRGHLAAFLEQRGVDAVVRDYADDALFYCEEGIYRGKRAIYGFFTAFFAALPEGAIDHFTLRSLQVDRSVAFITWNVGEQIPLGTDTFVVADGKIVAQTFVMHVG